MSQPSPLENDPPAAPSAPAGITAFDLSDARRRALLPWRFGFVAYALLLTTLTHWPNLQMAPPGARPRDKIMHWLCFGGLTILLWRTRWIKRSPIVIIIALAWAALDELTQGLFVPGRPFTMFDALASALGVLSAGCFIAAMRPVGGDINQLRVRRFEYLIDTILARPRAWLALLPQTILLAALVGSVVWFSTRWYHGVPDIGASFVAIAVGAVAGALGAIAWLYQGELARFSERRTCSACGASCAETAPEERGRGMCPDCGESFHLGVWTITADLPRESIVRMAVRAAVPSIVIGVLVLLGYAAMVYLYGAWPAFRAAVASSIRQADIIGSAIDMTMAAALGSLAIYRFRAGMARLFDRQAESCRVCAHDVHATPLEQGIGRCPECGTAFMRADTA